MQWQDRTLQISVFIFLSVVAAAGFWIMYKRVSDPAVTEACMIAVLVNRSQTESQTGGRDSYFASLQNGQLVKLSSLRGANYREGTQIVTVELRAESGEARGYRFEGYVDEGAVCPDG